MQAKIHKNSNDWSKKKGDTFRGYIRCENESVWTPLFLPSGVPDPDYPDFNSTACPAEPRGNIVHDTEDLIDELEYDNSEYVDETMGDSENDNLEHVDDTNFDVEMGQFASVELARSSNDLNKPSGSCVRRLDFSGIESDPEVVNRKATTGVHKSIVIKTDFTSPNIHDVGIEVDSDHEQEDSKEKTLKRLVNKKARHNRRNMVSMDLKPYDLPRNVEFTEKFVKFLQKTMIATSNEENSTIKKSVGHIIKYPDSYLIEMCKNTPNFDLSQLLNFSSNDYVDLVDPLDWLTNTCKDRPSHALEKLKSLSHLRKFIMNELNNPATNQLSGSLEDLMKKNAIAASLDRVERSISDNKLFSKYKTLVNQEKVEKDKVKDIIDGSITDKEANCVRIWNESEAAAQIYSQMDSIYQQAIKTGTIGSRKFATVAQNTRNCCIISDGNRRGSYNFKNKDLRDRKPLYFPEGYNQYNELPEGWNPNIPPSPTSKPSLYVIRLSGILS